MIQRQPGAAQAVVSQILPQRERVLSLRYGVQVPAVQLAELLAELADVESDPARQPRPVRIPFLHVDLAVFEADEDLRGRVRVERRLKSDFELAGIEIVTLHSRRGPVGADVAGDADLGIELRLVALAADELRRRTGVATLRRAARRRRRCGPERRELIARSGITRGTPRGRLHLEPGEDAEHAVEARLEDAHLGRERIHLSLGRGGLLSRGGRGERAHEEQQQQRMSVTHRIVISR